MSEPANTVQIVSKLVELNKQYRNGEPSVSDDEYDRLVEALREVDPDNSFLLQVEPEEIDEKTSVRHPTPMLSTQKAYTQKEVQDWVNRIETAAVKLGISEVVFRVTPKLDGLAGRDDGEIFATRGNGRDGTDITFAFDRGIIPVGGRGLGVGEIVITQSYFENHCTEHFEHPRNMAVGIISADVVSEFAKPALSAGAVRFVPYTTLNAWEGNGFELTSNIAQIKASLVNSVDYALDGLVAEVTSDPIKAELGATNHHNRWQIALKEQGVTAKTTIKEIVWQTGRTGNITPVLIVEPTRLSGATISRVTAHHAGMVRERCLGAGAEIEIVRSGEVIPKLIAVHKASDTVSLPSECPSCAGVLTWRDDFLRCEAASSCAGQVASGIRHWFKTLGSADGMGEKTIARIVKAGFSTLERIYKLTEIDLVAMGFGPGQTTNILAALKISLSTLVEDARFLSALGIKDLGIGESRRLLTHYRLSQVCQITPAELEKIKGFGPITSISITEGLTARTGTISHLLSMGFNIEVTPLLSEKTEIQSPVAGKNLVFTGKMTGMTRNEMKRLAREMGANVQSAVSGTTDLLIAGEKAGSKLSKAEKLGVEVLSEREWQSLIS